MDKRRAFLNELYKNKIEQIPFIKYFQNDKFLRKELFTQYLETEVVPNFSLYLKMHFTNQELDVGFSEIHEKIPSKKLKNVTADYFQMIPFERKIYALERDFNSLISKEELPDKFYGHSISSTTIIKELKHISIKIEDFKSFALQPSNKNLNEYATYFAKDFINKLQGIKLPALTIKILEEFTQNKENNKIFLTFAFGRKPKEISEEDCEKSYREMKLYADNYINEFLKEHKKLLKVKALFKFIEFLHSNIDNFKKYDKVIKELNSLYEERNKVKPRENFRDKLKYDEVQSLIKEKIKIVQKNITKPIKAKVTKLNICDLNETNTLWNWNISGISYLKENFSQRDVPEIFRYKKKYLEYRTATNGENYFELQFFFDDLDEILKVLFDYFKETEHNEFEAFERNTITVNSLSEAVKQIQKGNTSISIALNAIENERQQNITEELREQRKNHKIAFDLVGKNNANTVNIVYHHIEEILNKYNISYSEARQILLNMQGSFSPKQIETIVEPIITYLERSNDTTLSKLKTEAIELPDKKNINKSNNLPVFDAQIIDTILEILNVHFRNQNKELKSLLENQHKPTEKLNFTNNGNKLADFFKQLFEAKLISNCTKKELEQWIFENFTFKSGGTQKDFKLKTLEDIISNKGAKPPCMNPLIKMENGKVIKV